MAGYPFPDDPNAEACVHTGGKAYARIGDPDGPLVRGWYGSTVVDGEVLVCLDASMPRGPVCDAVLREAIGAGRVYDPEGFMLGEIALSDVPDAVVEALASDGMASALRALDGAPADALGLHVPPIFQAGEDDPLTSGISASLFGRPRHPGPDIGSLGVLHALSERARGRPFAKADIPAAAKGLVERIRSAEAMTAQLMDDLSRPASAPGAAP